MLPRDLMQKYLSGSMYGKYYPDFNICAFSMVLDLAEVCWEVPYSCQFLPFWLLHKLWSSFYLLTLCFSF